MKLPLQDFPTIVGNAAAAVQGAARQLLDLSVGSTLRAVLEANASLALWMQWLVVLLLQATRAATSIGPDLDSWVADFGLARLPALPASGRVQFARFVPNAAALVPGGTVVRTADGSLTYGVVADPTNPAWSAALGGYLVAVGSLGVDVPVQASIGGNAGNVQAGAVSLIAAALPGIDTVGNSQPLSNGLDAEADAALRTRFQSFLDTRARATPLAVGAAIQAQRQGLTYAIAENTSPDGSVRMGSFLVTVDDGSGFPPAAVIAAAAVAIEAVRPIGTTYGVRPPTVLSVPISLAIVTTPAGAHADVAPIVAGAIALYADTLPIGAALSCSRVAQLAYDASPRVVNVGGVLLGGGVADVSPGFGGVLKAAAVTVG